MGYLVCEKCGGYYELKEGEAIDDFEGCQCGGKFKFVKTIDELNLVKDQQSDSVDKSVCPNCGSKNDTNIKFCGSCGKPLIINYIPEKPQKKISDTNTSNKNEITEINRTNIVAIISGFFTVMFLYFIYFLSIYIVPALFSGIVVGFLTSTENYIKSVLYGAITSFIGILIIYVVINFLYYSHFSFLYTNISIQPLFIIEILLLAIVFGSLGGFIGSYLGKKITINTNSTKKL